MKTYGKIIKVAPDVINHKTNVTLSLDDSGTVGEDLQKLNDSSLLMVELKKYKSHRSLDANAMLWACLQELANAQNADKWDLYLLMLRRYGKYEYVAVRDEVVQVFMGAWRECEIVGRIETTKGPMTQLLCYYGSSMYNTQEFSRLLDGVLDEMKQSGLQPPPSEAMRRALELWEKSHEKKN